MIFEDALDQVLRYEGGYVDHPDDPGGETNYGITVRTARAYGYNGPMREIPMATVREIYRHGYWEAARCNEIPDRLRLLHFDSAVNSGPARAARWLQAALDVAQDGVIGPVTLRAAAEADPAIVAMRYAATRLEFLAGLPTFRTFGVGWTRRVAGVLRLVAQ